MGNSSKEVIANAVKAELKNQKLSLRGLASLIELQPHQICRITGQKNYNIETLLTVLNG